jgi:putative membrane protein
MRMIVALVLALVFAVPVSAHGPDAVRPETAWRAWSLAPIVVVPIVVTLWLYGRGARRLWARAGGRRGLTRAQAASFVAGVTVLIVALVSPLDALAGTLLSAHMVQHGLLVAVAPPLLVLGRPGVALAWALPGRWRRGARALRVASDSLSRPPLAAVLHGLALWVWHAAAAFDAALAHGAVHALEHVSFLGTALLFWSAVVGARASRRAAPALGAMFATLLHGGILGALITLAPQTLYRWYRGRTELWGLSPLEDQQLAGLLMWVPLGTIYLAACVVLASRLVTDSTPRINVSAVDSARRHHDVHLLEQMAARTGSTPKPAEGMGER